jgi:N utilization substance protein B
MPGIRRQARMIALQTLYEYDIANHAPTEILQRHTEERNLHPKVVEYAEEIVLGVRNHLADIDAHIQSAAQESGMGAASHRASQREGRDPECTV